MKTREEIETLKESLRLPTAFAYQTATQRMALDYIEQLEEALLLMVYQYCQEDDDCVSHRYMVAGEHAFAALGIENYCSIETISKRLDEMEGIHKTPIPRTIKGVPKWTSVAEHLPPTPGKYLVYSKARTMYTSKFDPDIHKRWPHFGKVGVTNWMPRPEGPKETGKDWHGEN